MRDLESTQLIVVVAGDWNKPSATMHLYERASRFQKWNLVKGPMACLLGKQGLAWGRGLHSLPDEVTVKKEGDMRSPSGIFPLKTAFGSKSQKEIGSLQIDYLQTHSFLEYIDDPNSKYYNQCVDIRTQQKDWNSAEKMLRKDDDLYTLGLIVSYNEDPVIAGEGSCIFMHTWRNQDSGSAGCTVLSMEELESLVLWLNKERNPLLVQGTKDALKILERQFLCPTIR